MLVVICNKREESKGSDRISTMNLNIVVGSLCILLK